MNDRGVYGTYVNDQITFNALHNHFAKRLTRHQIKNLLSKRGYTQKLVADLAKVSKPHVSMVIAGKAKSQRILDIISLLLGESVAVKSN